MGVEGAPVPKKIHHSSGLEGCQGWCWADGELGQSELLDSVLAIGGVDGSSISDGWRGIT
jgi:hypothetical protein